MRKTFLATLVAAVGLSGTAHAETSYETLMRPLIATDITANVVSICGLRSSAWYGNVKTRVMVTIINDAEIQAAKARLSETELTAAEANLKRFGEAQYKFMAGENLSGCKALVGKPFLASLDDIAAGK